jgi:hypothetical protein
MSGARIGTHDLDAEGDRIVALATVRPARGAGRRIWAVLRCPHCRGLMSEVKDVAGRATFDKIRRRRECLECHRRYTTYESIGRG